MASDSLSVRSAKLSNFVGDPFNGDSLVLNSQVDGPSIIVAKLTAPQPTKDAKPIVNSDLNIIFRYRTFKRVRS